MNVINLFNGPKIIGLISDPNQGKSNLLYHIITELKKGVCSIYTYGLKSEITGCNQIFSINELESIRDSIILIDETFHLFDLDDRKKKKQVETTLRLLYHNNNILLLSMVPENVKKFISSKLNIMIYKRVNFDDFVNGSSVKRIILNYTGPERGSSILNLGKEEALVFDGRSYSKMFIPYIEKHDTKKGNIPIFVEKKCAEKVEEIKNGL